MFGGNVFNGRTGMRLPGLTTIWIMIVVTFICLLITAVIGGINYGIYKTVGLESSLGIGLIGLLSFLGWLAYIYLPYDYIYTYEKDHEKVN